MHERRGTEEVFHDHLWHRQNQGVEPDLHNYAPDIVILTGNGIFRGHDGVRESGKVLHEQVPDATYEFETTLVSGEMAFLEWTATANGIQGWCG